MRIGFSRAALRARDLDQADRTRGDWLLRLAASGEKVPDRVDEGSFRRREPPHPSFGHLLPPNGRRASPAWGAAEPFAVALRWSVLAMLATGPWFPAVAQEAGGPLDGLLERLQIKAPPVPTSDFVTASRPKQDAGFIPVGRTHPTRATKVMTQAEVAAAEADLDAVRERQQRRAGRTPPAVPLKPPKNTPR